MYHRDILLHAKNYGMRIKAHVHTSIIMIFSDFNKNFNSTQHNHYSIFLRHNVNSRIIFPADSFVKLICKRRISDPHLYLDWNLSGGKYSLHKIKNYWKIHSIDNYFTFEIRIYMYMVWRHWAKIKVRKLKHQNKTMKYKSKHILQYKPIHVKKIFKQFHQKKFSSVLYKPYFI